MSKSTVLLTLGQHEEGEPREEEVRKKRFWLNQGQ